MLYLQEDRRLLGGLQLVLQEAVKAGKTLSLSDFQLPGNEICFELVLSYRLQMKQSLERSLIGIRQYMQSLIAAQ